MTDAEPRKPRFALFVATAAGLGYLPKAPGTWGSLGGILLYLVFQFLGFIPLLVSDWTQLNRFQTEAPLYAVPTLALVLISFAGVRAGGRVANYLGTKDPQVVVIDEVSGQFLALILSSVFPMLSRMKENNVYFSPWHSSFVPIQVNWKYLLVGFILFRLFDIWKPFPARQAETLPGGWGIMADDWVAGIYAALGLWIARMLGL